MLPLLRRILRPAGQAQSLPAPEAPPTEAFTAHNVRLDDGTQTFPAAGMLMSENGIFRAVTRLLRVIYPDGLQGRRLVDIGCLEGGFATEFARLGLVATGIEVRESNYRNCLRVKAGVDLPGLDFIKDDAANIASYGPFDVGFVCGLLYHLDRPKQFLTDVARVCRRALVLETHVATSEHSPAVDIYGLSEVTENEGLRGRWYPEHEAMPSEQLDTLKWSSWSNNRSFWLQKECLLQLLKDIGFDIVLEQFDCDDDIQGQLTTGWRKANSRVLLAAIRVRESD